MTVGCYSLLKFVVCYVVCVSLLVVGCLLCVVFLLFGDCCSSSLMVVVGRGLSLCDVSCALCFFVCGCLWFVG